MSRKNLLNVLIAGAIVLPVLFSGTGIANAQKFLSRQAIVNGLQIAEEEPKNKKKRHLRRGNQRAKARRAPSRRNQRVAKRRAPSQRLHNSKKFRAPANNRVALRRAPASRVPQGFRAPGSRNPNVAKSRAPGQVVMRRAPSSRAPQGFRAPGSRNPSLRESRAPARVALRRAPGRAPHDAEGGRAPQNFNNQFASTGNPTNGRGIRFETQGQAYPGAASVDLEILFEYNSAKISPESVRQLVTLGAALQDAALQGSRIMIAGHTDASGSNAYNNDLSFRRAQSVSDFLNLYAGVSPNRLAIEGYGEELLKYPDAPNSGQNRRVEIINLGT